MELADRVKQGAVIGAAGPDQLEKITLSDPKAVHEIPRSGINGSLIRGSMVGKLEQGWVRGGVVRVGRCGDGVLDPEEQCDDVRCAPSDHKTAFFPARPGFCVSTISGWDGATTCAFVCQPTALHSNPTRFETQTFRVCGLGVWSHSRAALTGFPVIWSLCRGSVRGLTVAQASAESRTVGCAGT